MTPVKQQYLDSIRHNSAYPTYRGVIGLISLIFYGLATVCALGALIGGLSAMSRSPFAGLGVFIVGALLAALYYLMGRLFKEAALILVDIGDSTLDANSRSALAFGAGAV